MAIWRTLVSFILCIGSTVAFADSVQMQSGPQQTVMIELYTSEGCNSCPPAERFLNDLVTNDRLWRTYIPLAFHVDYWDYLGWRDRFASPANTRRQQDYGSVLKVRTIYTPEFFINGKEWRRGFFGGMPAASSDQVGVLKASLEKNVLSATFAPIKETTAPLQLHVALLGMDLVSDIRAGENTGHHAVHQFVVLAQTQVTSDKLQWRIALPQVKHLPTRAALVVWISEPGNPTPLQATGGFIP